MPGSIFARIGTIKGESRDARHKDEIDVLSWSWGLAQTGTLNQGGGGGAGKVSFQGFTFTHHVDKASPLLMKACATGEHLKEATVTVRKAGKAPQDYLLVTMSDVLVASVSTSVNAEGDGAASRPPCAAELVDTSQRQGNVGVLRGAAQGTGR